MPVSRVLSVGLTIAGAVHIAAAPASAQDLRGEVVVDGSSTAYPITEAVAEEFNKEHPGVRVEVSVSGTGGGFKRFTQGETDISNASRVIKKKEHDATVRNNIEFIEIPVAYDGLTIVVHKDNDWVDHLTIDELREIFLDGRAAGTWKDVRDDWPAEPIKIFAPGTDSGTFDYFKEVVAGDDGSIRGDVSPSEDDNVLVRGVAGERNAIGFFGAAYYFENESKLRAIPIVNSETDEAVNPTRETIGNGSYAPFSRPLFIYVNKSSSYRREVASFVDFYLDNAPDLVTEVGYVPLPSMFYERAMKKFRLKETGTHFLDEDGQKKSGPLRELYK